MNWHLWGGDGINECKHTESLLKILFIMHIFGVDGSKSRQLENAYTNSEFTSPSVLGNLCSRKTLAAPIANIDKYRGEEDQFIGLVTTFYDVLLEGVSGVNHL